MGVYGSAPPLDRFTAFAMTEKAFAMTEKALAMTEKALATGKAFNNDK